GECKWRACLDAIRAGLLRHDARLRAKRSAIGHLWIESGRQTEDGTAVDRPGSKVRKRKSAAAVQNARGRYALAINVTFLERGTVVPLEKTVQHPFRSRYPIPAKRGARSGIPVSCGTRPTGIP